MSELLVEKQDYVATLTLNRPDRMNAISTKMLMLLGDALKNCDDDPDVRVIVLTGAGRGFCSGLDLKDAAAGTGIGGTGTLSAGGGAAHITPVICPLNGPAAGYGLDLALGCDMRLIADTAKLMPGFAKRGVVPESGGTWYLPRLVGWAKACELSFLGDDLSPQRSLELGLVNAIVPAADLMTEAQRWAAKIANNAPLAIKAMKRLFRHGLSQDFESHTHHVLLQTILLFRSKDFAEGVSSFMQKREPKFEGR